MCVTATLSQVTCLHAVGEFVYAATTFGCLVVIDACSLSVSAVCHPYTSSNPQITAILSLTADQSRPTDLSHDQPMARRGGRHLATVGRGYTDLVQRSVPQYSSSVSTSDNCTLLVWTDSQWNSHYQRESSVSH